MNYLLILINGILVWASHQLQCKTVSDVGNYFIDVCELRCECVQPSPSLFTVKCYREREDYACMSSTNRQRFHQAYLAITNSSHPLYGQMQYLVQKHSIGFSTIHTSQYFLHWHRAYQTELEDLLRHVDCRVTVPWWQFSSNPTNPYPYLPFGPQGLGDDGNCIPNGPFAPPWLPPAKPTCLVRNFLPIPNLPTLTQLNTIMSTLPSAYVSFSNQLEYNYHNGVHLTIGGDAVTGLSPNDGIFFLLHGNIDRVWDLWQKKSNAHLTAYSYPSNTPLPYMFGGITPSHVNDLEASGIRYVKTQSNKNGRGHFTFLPCLFVKLNVGWFSIAKLETSIINANLDDLALIPQNRPMTLSEEQQQIWLRLMPQDMIHDMTRLLKEAERQTNELTEKLTKITDNNMFMGMDLNETVRILNIKSDCPAYALECNPNEYVDTYYQPTPKYIPPSRSYLPPPSNYYRPTQVYLPPTPTRVYLPPSRIYVPPTRVYLPPILQQIPRKGQVHIRPTFDNGLLQQPG